jgi:hypothetical protein
VGIFDHTTVPREMFEHRANAGAREPFGKGQRQRRSDVGVGGKGAITDHP